MPLAANVPSGLRLLEPRRFGDERGWFAELWSDARADVCGWPQRFVQDNESFSRRGVLRGLHFQKGEAAQAKLVRAAVGDVLDVCLDLRVGSPTYGQHWTVMLSADVGRQLFIPKGFAHGFIVLSDVALVCYKCDAPYAPEAEGSVNAFDPALGIDWALPQEFIMRSDKDIAAPDWAAYAADPVFRLE